MTPESRIAVARFAPADSPRAAVGRMLLEDDLTQGFWKDVPALSWLMNLDTQRLEVRGTHPTIGAERASVSVQPEELANVLLRTQKDGPAPLRILELLPAADGDLHHFLIVGFPMTGFNGTPHPHLAGVAIDITRHKMRVDELAQQALIDELTGLYNLRGFFLFAEHELKVARRRGTRSAILYVDVDGLKEINDSLGHEQGSAVLIATATLLRSVFRECDVIARLGGDEFVVLASDAKGDPEQLRRRLRRAVVELETAGGTGVVPSLSAGVGSYPPDPGLRLSDLLTAADEAMYKDKFEKRGRTAGGGGSPDG